MKALIPRILASAALIVLGFAAGRLVPAQVTAQSATEKALASAAVRAEDAVPTRGEWGEWRRYFRGHTHGTKDLVVLAVTLKPGQAPHPPHRHAEEEFMILAEGTGTWHLDGKELPARKGDVVYAAPWTMHGLKNTADAPLTYYMVKWNNKGVKAPEKPTATAQEPKGNPKRQDEPASIAGAWDAEDRHLAMGTLYQPEHAVRMRHATVYFKQDGPKLSGYSITPTGNGLSGSNIWKDGRTEFRTVTFADGKLVFEFDVREVAHGWDRNIQEKATIRVEAQLNSDRLVGKWGLFLKDGSEPFRGEWEAVRTKESEKK